MYRDRFSEFGVHKKEDIGDRLLVSQKGIMSWGGTVFGRDGVRSAEGSVSGEYGISSPNGEIRVFGDIVSWKGDVLSKYGVASECGQIYARKVSSDGPVTADKITADEIQASYISCSSLRSRGMGRTKITLAKQVGGVEPSCYVAEWIDRLLCEAPIFGLAPASPAPKTSPVS